MFIDDTIILATSKDKCIGKVKTLLDYCQKYGMVINEKKTKYMAVGIEGTKNSETLAVTSSDGKLQCKIEQCRTPTWEVYLQVMAK